MGKPSPFHPDLARARWLPRTIVGRRSYRLFRLGQRLADRLTRSRAEVFGLAQGQRLHLFRPATPAATPMPALLWVHGGGLVIGSPLQDAAFCAALADRLGIVVAAPSYRLAPEHPYPAALDDVTAALGWLAARPEVDAGRIAVGGDSAGGGLAACLALRSSAGAGPKPCFQLLWEPMLDEATRRRRDPDPAGLRLWSARANRFGWGAYLAPVEGAVPATASAARASDADLAALPPAWLGVGTADLFLDETRAYGERLRAAGVPARLHEVAGAFHGFAQFMPRAAVSRASRAEIGRALAAGLGLGP